MPWRDTRRATSKTRYWLRVIIVILAVLGAATAILLEMVAHQPTCSLEAPQLWHRLTGCRIVTN